MIPVFAKFFKTIALGLRDLIPTETLQFGQSSIVEHFFCSTNLAAPYVPLKNWYFPKSLPRLHSRRGKDETVMCPKKNGTRTSIGI